MREHRTTERANFMDVLMAESWATAMRGEAKSARKPWERSA